MLSLVRLGREVILIVNGMTSSLSSCTFFGTSMSTAHENLGTLDDSKNFCVFCPKDNRASCIPGMRRWLCTVKVFVCRWKS